MTDTTCAVCQNRAFFQWTDTHGVAVCDNCGLPYMLYHYEDKKRVDKPPSIAVKESWLPLAQEYWAATKRRVFPGSFDMGIFSGRTRTYSGATEDEMREFDDWLTARKDRWPVDAVEDSTDADAVPELSEPSSAR